MKSFAILFGSTQQEQQSDRSVSPDARGMGVDPAAQEPAMDPATEQPVDQSGQQQP